MPIMENDEMESSSAAMTQAGILSFVGRGAALRRRLRLHPPPDDGHDRPDGAHGLVVRLHRAGGRPLEHPQQRVRHDHHRPGQRLRRLPHRAVSRACGAGTFPRATPCWKRPAASGPGITTGALSTALAFFVIGLSDFPGIAELGIIAGGGILLCWVAALTTLPAMIQWSDGKRPPWKVPAAAGRLRLAGPAPESPQAAAGRLRRGDDW